MVRNKKINTIINLFVVILLLFGILYNSDIIITAAMVLIIMLIIQRDLTQVFYLFVALIPFQSYLSFWGKSGIPFLLLAVLLNLLLHRDTTISKPIFLAMIFVVGLEIFNDILYLNPWTIASWCSFAIISVLFIDKLDIQEIESKYIIVNLYFGIMATVVANWNTSSTAQIARLGSEYVSLGGAMGLPLYMLIMTSLLLTYYIQNEINGVEKYFILFNIIFLNILALFSISRAYLLGISIIVICMALAVFTRNAGKAAKILIVIAAIAVIIMWVRYDELTMIVQRFQYRFEMHAEDDGRTGIWISCISYLREHLKALFLGNGALNYQNFGGNEYDFYLKSAHNIYLDCIMAFGIIGTGFILRVYRVLVNRCKELLPTKVNIVSLMPLLTISVYYITAGSFRYFKTWMYYIIAILFIYIQSEKGEKYDS